MFILDLLDNLPRLRLSTDHFKVFLWALKELGVRDVPTLSKFRSKQDELNKSCGVHTDAKRSPEGNVFYQNRVADLIALDYANPHTRPYLEVYPVRSNTVSETYQSKRLVRDLDPSLHTPMWGRGHVHWYIGELAMLKSGKLVVPRSWFRRQPGGEVFGEGYDVEVIPDESGGSADFRVRVDRPLVEFETSKLHVNYPDLQEAGLGDRITGSLPEHVYPGENPLRKIANGRRMYTSYVKAWGDDVSGNRSKQYNEHTNVYLAHANLPHEKLSQEYFVRFCSTSPHAGAGAQFDAMVESVTGANTWHSAFDCDPDVEEEVLFRIIPWLFPADNPQQSESCSHIGLKGNMWCRRCKLGGTEKYRETDEQYHAHFVLDPDTLRSSSETKEEVVTQIRLAALGVKKDVTERQRDTGVKDKLAEYWIDILLRRATEEHKSRISTSATADKRLKGLHGSDRATMVLTIKKEIQGELIEWLVQQPAENYNKLAEDSPLRHQLRPGDHFNALLSLEGIDIHRETPVELLHTYLLGQDKYVWHLTHSAWSPKQLDQFAVRLQGSSVDGLNILPIRGRYIVQYKENLIGKHFKALQQLAVFHIDDSMAPKLVQDLWKATGELGAMLWFTEIEDMETYLRDLEVLIANVLDIWSLIDPKRIFVKPKLHILLHILFDIRDQGPAPLYATEIFECFNAIFRMCSVLSNHQAPSRDIAWACADMDRFKHQISGGWWQNASGKFVRAGEQVRRYFQSADVQRRLGYVPHTPRKSGEIIYRANKTDLATWADVLAPLGAVSTSSLAAVPQPQTQWYHGVSVFARTGDTVRVSSWVFIEYQNTTHIGRVKVILHPLQPTNTIQDTVLVELFKLANSRHPHFQMPELLKIPSDSSVAVPSTNIACLVNVQHNCRDGKCEATGRRKRKQERTLTEIEEPFIEHRDDDSYLLNTHALHNAATIRKILPRHLTEPVPYMDPLKREEEHHKMAASLRQVQDERRAKEAVARSEKKKKSQNGEKTANTTTVPQGASIGDANTATSLESQMIGSSTGSLTSAPVSDSTARAPSNIQDSTTEDRSRPKPRKRARPAGLEGN